MIRLFKKKLLIFLLLIIIFIIIGSLSIYFYLQKQTKEKEAEQIKALLVEINEIINLMDAIKSEMPKELLETHEYLMSGALGGKLYRTDPKLKDSVIMYHGVKTQSVFINLNVKLKKELWIPVLYHEVAHNYWHTQNPVKTFEEFEAQLFNSENYATIINAQMWDLVMKYYPVKKEELKTELEQRLFAIYNRDTEIYNGMIKDNPEAKELWVKIIEADIREQKEYQKVLFEK
jgi:flagellar basal body-associated protein FliL